jgi:hypothetical protein
MKTLPCVLAVLLFSFVPTPKEKMSANDSIRVAEFYRLADKIQDQVWPEWSGTPAPMLLITPTSEFLTHHPNPPKEFADAGDGFLVRPRQFPVQLEATFPAFDAMSVIVVGAPETTASRASTRWLFTLMHEHFHQMQDGQPDSYKKVEALGLSHGDNTGMWMLNFPFPYEKPEAGTEFATLRDLLLAVLAEKDEAKFQALAQKYAVQRKTYFSKFSAEERKYFEFELWKEGVARYTQVRCAEAAANYQPSPEFAVLPDYESFATNAAKARAATLSELKHINLAESKRTVVYSFGAAEGFLLDRMHPSWQKQYFQRPFSLGVYFESAGK